MTLTLLSRPGCHLCDEARDALAGLGLAFTEVDITEDDALHARYLERIPVVVRDGEELCEGWVDEGVLRRSLS